MPGLAPLSAADSAVPGLLLLLVPGRAAPVPGLANPVRGRPLLLMGRTPGDAPLWQCYDMQDMTAAGRNAHHDAHALPRQ